MARRGSSASRKDVLGHRGIDYKGDISQTCKQKKFIGDYEFVYGGKKRVFGEHVTFGKGQDPQKCLSVHWCRDEKKKLLVIGRCGKHGQYQDVRRRAMGPFPASGERFRELLGVRHYIDDPLSVWYHLLFSWPRTAEVDCYARNRCSWVTRDQKVAINHLDFEFIGGPGTIAEVTLNRAANVLLMDPANYGEYSQGRAYRYYGGYATVSPFRLVVPGWATGTSWLIWRWTRRSACEPSISQQASTRQKLHTMKKNEYTQRIKLVPAAELKAYVIHEHQLDMLSQGSLASVKLNVSLCLLSIAATIFVAIYTAHQQQIAHFTSL